MSEQPRTPIEELAPLAIQRDRLTPALEHHEIYCRSGLLSLFWHGDPTAETVVLMCGGALGGVLGPGRSLYPRLAERLVEMDRGAIRIGYRHPNDLGACVDDLAAAADLASRQGAKRFILLGHSFGGGVVLSTAAALRSYVSGVVTFATQTSGAEPAEDFPRPILLFHGDRDQILPAMASEMVAMLCGGELVILDGADHLLTVAHDAMMTKLLEWIPATFAAHP